MQLLSYLLINGIAVFVASYILPGVSIDSFQTAIIVAIVLGIVNAVIKPVLLFFTFPITLITLGLFTFVINGLMVLLVDYLVPGFRVDSFLWAIIFSFVISIVSSFLNTLTKNS